MERMVNWGPRGEKKKKRWGGMKNRGAGWFCPHPREKKKKEWIQHRTVPGWSPTPVLSGLKLR